MAYSQDTQVLTESGWRAISRITTKDRVLSLNHVKNLMEYDTVQSIESEHFEGELYHWSDRADLLVSEEQMMYAFNDLEKTSKKVVPVIPSNKINIDTYYLKSGFNWNGHKQDYYAISPTRENGMYIPSKVIDMTAWMRFFGCFLRCGKCKETGVGKDKKYQISFVADKSFAAHTSETIREAGFGYELSQSGEDTLFYDITSKQLYEHLLKYLDIHRRYIPRDLLQLDKPLLRALLDGYTHNKPMQNKQQIAIASHSRQMMLDIQETILKALGQISDTQEVSISDANGNASKMYTNILTLDKNPKEPPRYWSFEHTPYDGDVYSISLTNNKLILVKRNNFVCFCGTN